MTTGRELSRAASSPERWERIKEIIDAAEACRIEDRAAYLDRTCGDDHGLREEIESLLARESKAPRLLTAPESDRMAGLLREHHADSAVGTRIGNFEIKEVLGYGGMGVVYRAAQDHPRRVVALKVVSGGVYANPYQRRQFRREVQSLARLNHTGIAAIYHAGSDEAGRQFFAMELVEGRTLNEYARDPAVSIEGRLRVFVRVCRAIHYAHQHGVIHRDIKPTNIIVRGDGQPKVLDFGLAKLIEGIDEASVSASLGRVHGTLSYMSPEQARAGSADVDTRSDVYSLGVVLFELLTACRPHELTQVSVTQAIETICHEPAPLAGSIVPDLHGDMEIIIDKALAKELDRRYQSADGLADDIERFLARQPISARRPSAIYQLRRLAARHKVPAVLVALLVVAVSALAVVATTMSVRLAAQRDKALSAQRDETESRKAAEEVVEFLVGLFEHGDPNALNKTEPTVRELVDAGAAQIRDELGDQPLVQARLMTVLGSVYGHMSDFESAKDLLNEGMAIRTRILGANHLEVSDSLLALGGLCMSTRDFDLGLEYLNRALDIRRGQLDECDPKIAEIIDALAANRFYAGDFGAAESYFRSMVDRNRASAGPESMEALQAQSNLGLSLMQQGKLEEADALLTATLVAERRVLGDNVQTAFVLDHMAHVRFAQGKPLEAEEFEKERVDMLRRVLHENHPTLTHALGNYAFLVQQNHGAAKAEPLLREVLARRTESLGYESGGTSDAMYALGAACMDLGKYEEAQSLFAEALRIREKCFPPNDESVISAAQLLAKAYQKLGRFEKADALLHERYRKLVAQEEPNTKRVEAISASIDELYKEWKRKDEPDDGKEHDPESRSVQAKSAP